MDSRHDHSETLGYDGSSSHSSEEEDRYLGLQAIVDQALLCSGRDRPETDEYLGMVNAWARILRSVPSEYLAECYTRAMENRSLPGLLTPNEVHGAWTDLRAELRRREVEAESQKYLAPMPPVRDGARYFAAGLEAARRMRGIPTPAGQEFDEADVQAAHRAIAPMVDEHERRRLEELRKQPAEVRAEYKRPGRDTLEKMTGFKFRRTR